MSELEIRPLAAALGAEIFGVDLAGNLSESTIADIRQALLDHGVVFFRNQSLDVDQHKALTRRFGDIFIHPNFSGGMSDPEVVDIVRKPDDTRIVGEEWHTDTTMMAKPPMGALLYAIDVPPVGGDTLFSSQTLAYERLSDGMKRMIDPLKCWHSDIRVAGPAVASAQSQRSTKARTDDAWCETRSLHPVVRTHPETDRKCLFVNHSYSVAFEGMTDDESEPLLDFLMDWGHRPEFTCRFRWEAGSLAFWDNRCVKHLAIHDVQGHERIMRRIQIDGDPVR